MPEKEFNDIFSKRLRYYLSLNNMTQLELAKKIGVGTTSIYNWCNGVKTPRMDKVDAMCKLFGCKRADLINEKNDDDTIPAIMQHFNRLNDIGKQEATKRVEELTYISKYTDTKAPILNAAHELANSSAAARKHDDDIMDNDEEWK